MTDFAPTLEPQRSSPRWAAPVAWFVIALCVIFTVCQNTRTASLLAKGENGVAANQIKLVARIGLATKITLQKGGRASSAELQKSLDGLFDALDPLARTPTEKLRVAILAGEIHGGASARQRLDELAAAKPAPELMKDLEALRTVYASGPASLDEPAQARLRQRHDFFGQLALAYGVAANAEPRQSLEAGVHGLLVRFALLGLAGLLLLVAAIALFITAVVLFTNGKIRRAYVPDPTPNSAFLEAFALYLLLFITLGYALRYSGLDVLSWEWLALLLIPLAFAWAKWRGATASQRKNAFGWHLGRGLHIEAPLGVVGFLAGLPVVAVGFILTLRLIKLSGATPSHPLDSMLQGDIWHTLALYGLACGLAPVLEETMFRGALFHHLRGRWGWLVGAPVVAVIFAVIHPQGWTVVPTLGAIALVLAALREWRGSIIAPMVAHALSNFIVLTMALLLMG